MVFVLLFFLGLRNALFVGIAIPFSMFLSFILLNSAGVSLHMMVLFSLVLALGMLVDNGIVVVENVYRLMDEGLDSFEATKKGIGEVAWPIIASTATTLAAFVPLALWPGIIGEFMQYLPITLMIVLGSSLFVALVITPVLLAVLMKIENNAPNKKKIVKSFGAFVVVGLLLFIFTTFQGIGANLLGANAEINSSGLSINKLLPEVSNKDHSLIIYHIINLMDKHALWLTGLLAVGLVAALQSTAAVLLMTSGSIVTRDLYKAYLGKNISRETELCAARIIILLIFLASFSLATFAQPAMFTFSRISIAIPSHCLIVSLCLVGFLGS